MQKIKIFAVFAATLVLAACGNSDLERGASGAAIGAVGAELTGGNVLVGATLGASAGVLCDDYTPQFCD